MSTNEVKLINRYVEETSETVTFNMTITTPEEEHRTLLRNIKNKLEERGITFSNRSTLTDEEMVDHIIHRWGNVLRRLAQIDL